LGGPGLPASGLLVSGLLDSGFLASGTAAGFSGVLVVLLSPVFWCRAEGS